jgi:hypothetical protein
VKTNKLVLTGISLMAACLPMMGQTNATGVETPAMPDNNGIYSLDQFGPVGTPANAENTFRVASSNIIAAGGGVILIPTKAAANWVPKNTTQEQWRKPAPPEAAKSWGSGVGVTVIDARGSIPRIMPPQATGLSIERTLNIPQGQSLSFWNYFPMVQMRNTILHGSTSYRDWIQEDVKAGKDAKFYVATIRGIFPGMFMSGGEYGVVQRLYVKALGYDKDKKMWYFTADAEADMPKGAIVGNKNHVNILDLQTSSHNENQTFDVRMWRHNYSQGDNYLFDARFKYMGDVHSTAGDENGVLYAAFVEAMTDIFRGQVDTWNPTTGELVYKGGDGGKTLGSGRPIVNLNPAKWITNGFVTIVSPASYTDTSPLLSNATFRGHSYPTTVQKNRLGHSALRMGGLIRFSADAPVTDDAVGRYFAVDEATEYVPKTKAVRRWYLIDSVTLNDDGTKDITIVRHWWGAKTAGSPTLYKPENYSWDGHEQPLRYIVAPGANAYDVSDGVNYAKRTIRLAPTPFAGSAVDFAPGDAIEQAIGPDPFKPTSFRSWLWDAVPGVFPASVFDIANNGVMRDSLFWVHGNSSGDAEKDRAAHYDRNPPWNKLFSFESACNTGIRFGADTAEAAILFAQPFHEQPIKWKYGGESNKAPQTASLTVARDTGVFTFSGPLSATGLSGDASPARNLRGKNVAVKAGETVLAVAFPVPETDGDYAVFVEQNWIGNRAIAKKTADGFTVQFEKPAPEGATLDWMIVR